MDFPVFVVIIVTVILTLLLCNSTIREGASFVTGSSAGSDWGGWPHGLYGVKDEKTTSLEHQNQQLQQFLRHGDGYGEVHSNMLSDYFVV